MIVNYLTNIIYMRLFGFALNRSVKRIMYYQHWHDQQLIRFLDWVLL